MIFLNKIAWRQSVERGVWSGEVIVDPPGLDDLSGFGQPVEQVLIETLVAQPAIEAFDEGVLGGFARRDVMPFDAPVMGPFEDGVAGHLGSVVGDDRLRLAPDGNDAVEFTSQPQA